MVIWATFVAPGAPVKPPRAVRAALQILVFGGAAVALFAAGRSVLAVAFAVVVIANAALMAGWHQ